MNGTTERELAEHAARLLASPNRPPLVFVQWNCGRLSIVFQSS